MENHVNQPAPGITAVIWPVEKDLGGFSVRRFLPHAIHRKVGPFVFFDHMGPADFKPGHGIDVRPHPHIGLATVTYLFDGEITHRDSLGYVQQITPGAVNWMIAGKGIAHSERTGDETRASGHRLHGIQIWVALPEDLEDIDPRFLHVSKEDLPFVNVGGADIRVIIGTAYGHTSPVKTYSPLFYLDVEMPAHSTFVLPEDYPERAVHVVTGAVAINDYRVNQFEMAVCAGSERIELVSNKPSRLVFFGGDPMTKRYVWWNFVSSSKEKIETAKQDWKDGRFEKIPGETEFIPLPEG